MRTLPGYTVTGAGHAALLADPLTGICGTRRLEPASVECDLARVTCGSCKRALDRIFDDSDERATEARIKAWTDTEPRVWDLKVHGSRYQRAGIPDHLLCVAGVFVAIETKRRGTRPTPLQDREMGKITRAGGYVYVVRSMAEFLKIVSPIMDQGCVGAPWTYVS